MNRTQERRAWTEHITGKKGPKYSNEKVVDASGRSFDSKREARRAGELELLQKLCKISDLKYQVRFELVPKQGKERAVFYIADATYIEDGQLIVEDSKGCRTHVFLIKRKLMLQVHGIQIREI